MELNVKLEKCWLMYQSIRYAGHIVTQHGPEIHFDRQFLGFASYYRRFVRNFVGVWRTCCMT
ncbi:hypothetical protein T4B_11077 [Trichinella pseudospiralis]|nr:hypothetical protein T4A_9399 [Trichinella pseudospiralis]KRZ33104.1 hypothetical protein T4B_11077 [Trichinella pseudospiralis]KRZ39585.1 hypothetical protein T4C_4461 [Trichinella pseudospiralis]